MNPPNRTKLDEAARVHADGRAKARQEDTGTDAPYARLVASSRNLHLIVGPGLKPWNIDVTATSGGVVELGGEVDRAEDKAEAVRIARDTEGLTRVEDHLRVR